MGLSICYNLSLPAETPVSKVRVLLARLRDEAKRIPFDGVSELVQFGAAELSGAWPTEGATFNGLEDVVNVCARISRETLYRESMGRTFGDNEFERLEVPDELPTVAVGFAVVPGKDSEPAAFGLTKLTGENDSRWYGWCCCKTQYASAHGDDHFLKCHTSVISLLDAAAQLGVVCEVFDEGGYFESRDREELLKHVEGMNRLIARFAGALSDRFEDAGGGTRRVQAEIFRHPEFERLEMPEQ
jgi:hypothetical protein